MKYLKLFETYDRTDDEHEILDMFHEIIDKWNLAEGNYYENSDDRIDKLGSHYAVSEAKQGKQNYRDGTVGLDTVYFDDKAGIEEYEVDVEEFVDKLRKLGYEVFKNRQRLLSQVAKGSHRAGLEFNLIISEDFGRPKDPNLVKESKEHLYTDEEEKEIITEYFYGIIDEYDLNVVEPGLSIMFYTVKDVNGYYKYRQAPEEYYDEGFGFATIQINVNPDKVDIAKLDRSVLDVIRKLQNMEYYLAFSLAKGFHEPTGISYGIVKSYQIVVTFFSKVLPKNSTAIRFMDFVKDKITYGYSKPERDRMIVFKDRVEDPSYFSK